MCELLNLPTLLITYSCVRYVSLSCQIITRLRTLFLCRSFVLNIFNEVGQLSKSIRRYSLLSSCWYVNSRLFFSSFFFFFLGSTKSNKERCLLNCFISDFLMFWNLHPVTYFTPFQSWQSNSTLCFPLYPSVSFLGVSL